MAQHIFVSVVPAKLSRMGQFRQPDVLAEVDHVLRAVSPSPPWHAPNGHDDHSAREYVPDYRTLSDLLAVPIVQGYAERQQSGRVAKSLDAYIAYELRRAGFRETDVFPRAKQPRVLAPDLAPVEQAIDALLRALADYEKDGHRLRPASLRSAITRACNSLPRLSETEVLGRFYKKQVDAVVLSDWLRGPDVLVSGKTMFSSYLNNKNNRYEEAIGEAHNLRDRYPLAAMGFVYLVRSNVFDGGAFELLRDLLVRLRRPDGPFDATVLLVANWDDETLTLRSVTDPAESLALPRFFEDLLDAAMRNAPVGVHQGVRQCKLGTPPGGFPPEDDAPSD